MIPSYLTLAPPAGLYRSGTIYQSKGRWYDANLIRFQQDEVKPIGGWQQRPGTSAFAGAARCALTWRANDNNSWIAVGTSKRLYVQDEGATNLDITPMRLHARSLGANPVATTLNASLVTITDAGHGARTGDRVLLAGATTAGGIPAAALTGWFAISSPTTNTYVVDTGVAATATVSAGGGSAVAASYEIKPLGANPFATASTSSPTITVTDAGHGGNAGDAVVFGGASALAGFTADELNTAFVIASVVDANTYTITGPRNATSVTSGGGSAVVAKYELHAINAGRDDASQNLGYGGALYGRGFYGVSRPATGAYLPATVWSLDAWGQYLVGCSDTDGAIYQWTLDVSKPAAVLPGAPTGCAGIVVTQEGFLFALGAGGDGRRVQWCDQQDNTLWTPDATNQAGDYDLATVGTLQCGKALPSGALCFTDVDVWRASYLGTPLVYGFERVGSGCGVISKGAVAAVDSTAVWMGPGPVFWLYDGQAVQPLDCDVLDYVADMNTNQASKVSAAHVALYGEIWWFYPSGSSNECDTYVCWCYRESRRLGRSIWTFGKLARTCGTGKGVFVTPIMVDPNGALWLHESGLNWGGAQPYIESGPVELGDGGRMAEVQRIIPDERQDGALTATFYGRQWPDGAEFSSGPFTLASPTDLLFQAREIRVRFTANGHAAWRVGPMRLEVVQGDPL